MDWCDPNRKPDLLPSAVDSVWGLLQLYGQPLERNCALLGKQSLQVIDIAGSSTPGNTLNMANAFRLMVVSASQHEASHTSVPATFRPPGHPKAGGTEDRLHQRKARLCCKCRRGSGRYRILYREAAGSMDR